MAFRKTALPKKLAPSENLVGSSWQSAVSGETYDDINPGNTKDCLGAFPRSGKADVDGAVAEAKQAYQAWRLVPPPKRGLILKKCADVLLERKEQISRLMSREMGKPITSEMTRSDLRIMAAVCWEAVTHGPRQTVHGTFYFVPSLCPPNQWVL